MKTSVPKSEENKISLKQRLNMQSVTLYIGMIAIFIVFSVISPIFGKNFLQWNNIMNIIVQTSIISVIAIGQTMIILTGGIDLSVGSIVAFVGIFMGLLLTWGVSLFLAIIIVIAIGALFGLINGAFISYGKIPAFIMTLGMMGIARGMTLAVNSGKPVSGFPPELEAIANFDLFGIPSFVIYVIVLYTLMFIILQKTKYGRYVYAVGGGRSAAKLSGINTSLIEMITYTISGIFTAIGGVLLMARLCYASPTAGDGYELDTIAAVVIGGISLTGGFGNLLNTLVGAIILGTLKNGLTILNVSSYYQQIVIGVAIILAVFFDKAKERHAE